MRRLKRTGADVVSHGEEVVLISEKFEAGTTVKEELAVLHPGSYILRWDNTHSRMRGKQIQCELTAPLACSSPPRSASEAWRRNVAIAVDLGTNARYGRSPLVPLR